MKNWIHSKWLDRMAIFLLNRLSHSNMNEGFGGDVEEEFESLLHKWGSRRARRWLWYHTFMAIPKSIKQTLMWASTMMFSYFKIAVRNLQRHRSFSFINIIGMTLSLATTLLIIQLLNTFLSYDEFHEHKDKLYQIHTTRITPERRYETAAAPMPLAQEIAAECPGIEKIVRVKRGLHVLASSNDKVLNIRFKFADPDFFNIFTYPLQWGDKHTALEQPNSIVLTHEVAQKFYHNENPIGQSFHLTDVGDFIVTGVMEDHSHRKSSLRINPLISMNALAGLERLGKMEASISDWQHLAYQYLYVTLNDPQQVEQVATFLRSSSDRHSREGEDQYRFEIQKVTELLPGPELYYGEASVPPIVITVLCVVGALIMVTAGFNYSNLSLARILSRAREVGIRKVVGAKRTQLYAQFTSEAVTITLISLMFAYAIYRIILIPLYLSMFDEIAVLFEFKDDLKILLFFVLFSLATGVVAGFLPSLYITKFRTIEVLKNLKGFKGGMRVMLRKVMIVAQFSLTLVFIVATMAAISQARQSRKMDLGYNIDNVLTMHLQGIEPSQFIQKIEGHHSIVEVAASSSLPGISTTGRTWLKRANANDSVQVEYLYSDANFISTMQFQLMAGDITATQRVANGDRQVYVSEEAARRFGFPSALDAVGSFVQTSQGDNLLIAGVVKDYLHGSVTDEQYPSAMIIQPDRCVRIEVRVAEQAEKEVLAFLRQQWLATESAEPFHCPTYQERFEESLMGVDVIMKLLIFVASMAIVVCVLGMIGIADYSAKTRLKEIGIRKVLGAGEWTILKILSGKFLGLIFMAGVLAAPLALVTGRYVLSIWTNSVDVSWLLVLLGFGAMSLLGLIAVVSQTLKAARANPVESLKYE
ncbi:ABC transporter permease [bacterium]|nr:ABC transporter permease [bacterium]